MSGRPFSSVTAIAVPLVRDNINTDLIIPSREMRSVSRQGLAEGLFSDWRYLSIGGREKNPDFVLNDGRYAGAGFLLAGANFGCGSSREHAAWALVEYGFRAVIAESFNPIFRGNAVLNGLVPVSIPRAEIDALAAQVCRDPVGNTITVDLDTMDVTAPNGGRTTFSLGSEQREMLREGLDSIALTMKRSADIDVFRSADRMRRPWAYLEEKN